MKIFAILPPVPNPALDAKVAIAFENNHLKVAPNQWFVAAGSLTAAEVSHKLDITRLQDGKVVAGSMGSAVILAVSTYFGNGPTNVWEWLKAKTEATV